MFSFVYTGDCNIELVTDSGTGLLFETILDCIANVLSGTLNGSGWGQVPWTESKQQAFEDEETEFEELAG